MPQRFIHLLQALSSDLIVRGTLSKHMSALAQALILSGSKEDKYEGKYETAMISAYI